MKKTEKGKETLRLTVKNAGPVEDRNTFWDGTQKPSVFYTTKLNILHNTV